MQKDVLFSARVPDANLLKGHAAELFKDERARASLVTTTAIAAMFCSFMARRWSC